MNGSAVHKSPHLTMLDPDCERCLTMKLGSLGPEWCEQATGLSPQQLRRWAFQHGPGLGERVMELEAMKVLGSRVGNYEPGAAWPHP